MKRNRGQAIIVIAVCLLSLLGLMALVMDTGRIYIEHAKLQRAVDSASLAAVQDLPVGQNEGLPYEIAYEAAELNKLERNNMEVQFTAPPGYTKMNTVSVTATRIIDTRLASILGYEQWPIAAQSVARSGPIAVAQHWIPIGILEEPDDFINGITMDKYYRLGNTGHTPANSNDVKRLYVPLDHGSLRNGVANTISSKLSVGQNVRIKKNYDAKDVCEGVDDRVRSKYGSSVVGCFDVSSPIDYNGLNIVGPGVRKDWAYGEDPRLVYIPFVEVVDNNNVKIKGFGLFYVAYAHYDQNPHGGTMPLTELVGYFVRTVVEGPIVDAAVNYGVIGIEYVDPKDLSIP